jgi:AAA domain-containing protein
MATHPTSPHLTYEESIWRGDWDDGYAVRALEFDTSRPGVCRATIQVLYHEEVKGTEGVDLLNTTSCTDFGVAFAAINGLPPVAWYTRLKTFYDAVQQARKTSKGPQLWSQAATAAAFCAQEDEDLDATVKDFLVPGCITFVAAPRGSGKSFVALFLASSLAQGGIFRMERLAHQRVLLVDRDNPQALIRQRLRLLGADKLTTLKVLTRETAPPLTDREAWAQFPADDYDVIIVDSLSAFTEGVSEKEGRQTQEFLATLKNLAARDLAILALANTNKAGTNIRGRGEQSDAVDIVYEARNMTGWEPTHGPCWWESLPEAGEQAWQHNTTRRVQGGPLRIGFIPTKFRLATLPQPFVLEMDTTTTPWGMRDITTMITREGVEAAHAHRTAERQKLDAAAWALVAALRTHPPDTPMLKREAEEFLQRHGLKRRQARNLLDNGYNRDVHPDGLWVLRELPGARGNPIGVKLVDSESQRPLGEKTHGENNGKSVPPRKDAVMQNSIWADGSTGCGQKTTIFSPSLDAVEKESDFGRESPGQRPKSAPLSPADLQGKSGEGVFWPKSHAPAENLSPPEQNLCPPEQYVDESWPEAPDACLHEHVDDLNVCNDCGELLPPSEEPV